MNGLLNAASVGWATAVLTLLALCATLIATVRIVRGPRHADRVVALDIFLAAAWRCALRPRWPPAAPCSSTWPSALRWSASWGRWGGHA
nr:hypothetical protein [Pseudomonas aeruginosa]